MEANGVNYYKGVLLCSRPNQSPSIPKQKPFCGRVTPHDSLGLVPTKQFESHEVRKRVLPVLNNHKKWLEGFKKKKNQQKQAQEQQKQKQIQKLQKIKQEGNKRRQQFKKSTSIQKNNQKSSQLPSINKPLQKQVDKQANAQRFKEQKRISKKGVKPGWAKTDKQREAEQEQQVDQLLDFFDNNDVKDYLDDTEINNMLKDLKQRIQLMKNQGGKQEDWRKKQIEKIQQNKQENAGSDQQKKDDILSRISRNSQAKSVISQKTAERVQQLQKKKKQKQWDKNTVTDKKSHAASVNMQIAKNVADEVLRNYPVLKHHSNQSIRKLLEKQAHQQIKA